MKTFIKTRNYMKKRIRKKRAMAAETLRQRGNIHSAEWKEFKLSYQVWYGGDIYHLC
jgi:hypothetical protein